MKGILHADFVEGQGRKGFLLFGLILFLSAIDGEFALGGLQLDAQQVENPFCVAPSVLGVYREGEYDTIAFALPEGLQSLDALKVFANRFQVELEFTGLLRALVRNGPAILCEEAFGLYALSHVGSKCQSFEPTGYNGAIVGTLFGAEEGASLRKSRGLQEGGE